MDAVADGVAIVGGGPAGMALALALHKQGVAAEIFDVRPRGAAFADQRVLALSHGSRLMLEWLGVWQTIPHTAIASIHVSQQGGFGRTRFSAREENVPALGYVLAAGDLARNLDGALECAGIPFHGERHVTPGNMPSALLVAWAEGAADAGGALVTRDYGQHAIISTVTPEEPHRNTAWERFTPGGPVAALPHGRNLAVVLACKAEEAETVTALDDRAFLDLLQSRFGRRVRFSAATARQAFPLALRYRECPVGPRQVWIGNAAQTLHPVAGQGFNLALRDIFELARCLVDEPDPGAPDVLARHATGRRLDRRATVGFTDALVRIFGGTVPLLRHARGGGLLALDLLPPLRSFLVRRMMFGAHGW